MLPEQQQRILGYFIEEAKDHLNTIEQGLLNLQGTLNDPEMINEVFRAAHSIKGGSAMLGLSSIQRTAHRLEDCFKVLKENPIQVDQKLESLFLGVSDTLKSLLEHLSGPFSLSEETANTIMSEAEPVFGWLHEHLELLVGEQGGSINIEKPELVPTPTPTLTPTPTAIQSSITPLASGDSWQQFQNQVLQKLRNMLQLFKQEPTPENRKGLEACCQYLAIIGDDLNLNNWCHLCRACGSAIVNPDNSYLTLAKVVITDIKQAQELALTGRDAEIKISQQLEVLLGVPEIELLELNSDFLEEFATSFQSSEDTKANAIADDIYDFITHTGLDIEDSENNIDSLFELSEQIDSETANLLDLNSEFATEDSNDNVNSLLELSTQIDGDSQHILTTKDMANDEDENINFLSINIQDIDVESGDDELEDAAITNIILDTNGPEVGIAELTELDELFKDDAPELDGNWNGEENVDIVVTNEANSDESETDAEAAGEVEDLLIFEDSTSIHDRAANGSEELTIMQLFGNFLDEDEPTLDKPLESVENGDLSNEIPEELSNAYREMQDYTIIAPIPEQFEFLDDLDDSDKTSINLMEAEDNLLSSGFNDLLDFSEHIFSDSSDNTNINDNSQTSEYQVQDLASSEDIELINSPQSHPESNPKFDQFSAENILEIDTIVNNVEQENEDKSTLKSVEITSLERTNLETQLEFDDLLTNSKINDSLPTNPAADTLDMLFDSLAPEVIEFSHGELSQQQDEGVDFWAQTELIQEQQSSELESNADIGKALEESLFEVTLHNSIFDTSQDANISLNESDDFELDDDLDISFPQTEESFDFFDDEAGDLFEELTPSQIIPLSAAEIDTNESPNYTQQPESLEFTPEFTQNIPTTTAKIDDENTSVDTASAETEIVIFHQSHNSDFTNENYGNQDLGDNLFDDDKNEHNISEHAPTALTNAEIDFIDNLFGESTVPQLGEEQPDENNRNNIYQSAIPENQNLLTVVEETEIHTNESVLPSLNIPSDITDNNVEDLRENFEESFEESLEASMEIYIPEESETSTPETIPSLAVENPSFASEEINNLEQEASEDDDFAALDALLGHNITSKSNADSLEDDDFAALDALLGNDATPVVVSGVAAVTATAMGATTAKTDHLDDFGDLEKLLADADQSISTPTTGANAAKIQRVTARRTARFEQLMKVPVKHLDDMSNLVGELVVNRNTLEQDQERLRQSLDNLLIQVHHLSDVGARMQELYERSLLEASLLATRKGSFSNTANVVSHKDTDRGFSELEMDRFTPFHTLSQEMIELIVRVRESASDIDFVTEETERVARQFRQVTTQLQEGLTRARMVPFSQVTDRVKRGVRDNAIKCGKQVELVIEGQDTLIDKMILEHLTDPLVHMLNNAIAHGIETPEERQSKGKSPVGTITVRAFHQGNQTVISVSDDGAGIDPEQVKQKAIRVGLITPAQAKTMPRIEVYELLFQPNFSTRDKADDLAGRGVGMDVVRTSISEIRGTINTDSTLNKGTNFTIRLPLTLSICKALSCVSDKARVAFPMDGVEDTLDVPVRNIQKNSAGESFISWRDTQLPFKPLKDLLTLNRQLSRGSVYGGNRDDDMVSVVVIRSGNTLIALQVDQVLSEQEIVIKQFEGPAPKPIGVAGATVLGDGRIMPIADVLEIIDIFQGRTSKQSAVTIFDAPNSGSTDNMGAKIDPTVLIVDDSITVRELLSLSFNKAGYRVEQARDGQEAWDKLRSGLPCDIVFCDIEMPRCDGLELLSRIQKEPSLNHLPIAMLTSRGADKHKQMAINLGASGYFTKPYLEEALLEAAARMLKGEKLVSNG
ncbi:response regulator [Calothrix sp. UHCC 0171]|uniref:hybrid sensor histidine kinase/response regulator n=1 Tax=Calothrix sp. UHCC 0171 TaxID=3110245 RepID=UPI002B20F3C2|nr:response regulator [Calothrix sp. UHCC 0171]MEA5569442.1 response regulator [Calothrix sp. UHCC 0171]